MRGNDRRLFIGKPVAGVGHQFDNAGKISKYLDFEKLS